MEARPGVPARLPLAARNALADLLVRGLTETGARRVLESVCAAVRSGADLDDQPAEVRTALEDARYDHGVPWRPAALEALGAYCEVAAAAPRGTALPARLEQARWLFEKRLYFEVHEVLEPAWQAADGRSKQWLQGLIQAAVSWYHWGHGNRRGAAALARAAAERLGGSPSSWSGFPLGAVRRAAERWAVWLDAGGSGPEPSRPHLFERGAM